AQGPSSTPEVSGSNRPGERVVQGQGYRLRDGKVDPNAEPWVIPDRWRPGDPGASPATVDNIPLRGDESAGGQQGSEARVLKDARRWEGGPVAAEEWRIEHAGRRPGDPGASPATVDNIPLRGDESAGAQQGSEALVLKDARRLEDGPVAAEPWTIEHPGR